MKNLLTRRTIRKYSDQEVSEELLNRLMAEAARTQTMGNLQLYSVVVTRSDELKQKLAPAHFNQPMVTQAQMVSTTGAWVTIGWLKWAGANFCFSSSERVTTTL